MQGVCGCASRNKGTSASTEVDRDLLPFSEGRETTAKGPRSVSDCDAWSHDGLFVGSQ